MNDALATGMQSALQPALDMLWVFGGTVTAGMVLGLLAGQWQYRAARLRGDSERTARRRKRTATQLVFVLLQLLAGLAVYLRTSGG